MYVRYAEIYPHHTINNLKIIIYSLGMNFYCQLLLSVITRPLNYPAVVMLLSRTGMVAYLFVF